MFDETVAAGETDMATMAAKIKQSRAELILVNLGLGQAGMMVKRLREQGVSTPLFSTYWLTKTDELETAGQPALEGTIVVDLDLEKPRFTAKFKQLFPKLTPNAISYTCYCALGSLLEIIAANPDIKDRETLYKAMRQTGKVELLDGPLKLDDREGVFDLNYKRITAGQPLIIGRYSGSP